MSKEMSADGSAIEEDDAKADDENDWEDYENDDAECENDDAEAETVEESAFDETEEESEVKEENHSIDWSAHVPLPTCDPVDRPAILVALYTRLAESIDAAAHPAVDVDGAVSVAGSSVAAAAGGGGGGSFVAGVRRLAERQPLPAVFRSWPHVHVPGGKVPSVQSSELRACGLPDYAVARLEAAVAARFEAVQVFLFELCDCGCATCVCVCAGWLAGWCSLLLCRVFFFHFCHSIVNADAGCDRRSLGDVIFGFILVELS